MKLPNYKKPVLDPNLKMFSPEKAKQYNAGQRGINTKGMYDGIFFIDTLENRKKLNQINSNIKKVMSGEGY